MRIHMKRKVPKQSCEGPVQVQDQGERLPEKKLPEEKLQGEKLPTINELAQPQQGIDAIGKAQGKGKGERGDGKGQVGGKGQEKRGNGGKGQCFRKGQAGGKGKEKRTAREGAGKDMSPSLET